MNVARFAGSVNSSSVAGSVGRGSSCHPAPTTEAVVLFVIGSLGMGANLFLMLLILLKRPLRRWSQGLLFHQGLVDCGRASLLVPLGISVFLCKRLPKCMYIEMAFLLLVTVSTVNMLTSVINDASLVPEQDPSTALSGTGPRLQGLDNGNNFMDSPQCVGFGLFIIWFASLTINLGPTLLGGVLSVTSSRDASQADQCPVVYAPVRNYVLGVLWVGVNLLCVALTGLHLRKLYRDLTRSNLEAVRIAGMMTTMISVRPASPPSPSRRPEGSHIESYIRRLEEEGIRRVKSFAVVLAAYVLFWGPLFTLTLLQPGIDGGGYSVSYEITLHVAFVHAFVNPTLLLVLNRDLRKASSPGPPCCCGPGPTETLPSSTEESWRRGYMETTI